MDFTGRLLKGFVFVEASGLGTDGQLREWVSMARAFAQSLRPKATGSRRTETRRHLRSDLKE
jgi:hypothetical protein